MFCGRGETCLFQRAQQPPHSEWSRCCKQSSGTGPRGLPGSQSGPKKERQNAPLHEPVPEIEARSAEQSQRSAATRREDVLQSEQWCGYSRLSSPQPVASPPGLSSSRRSGLTCLGRNRLSSGQRKMRARKKVRFGFGSEKEQFVLNTDKKPFLRRGCEVNGYEMNWLNNNVINCWCYRGFRRKEHSSHRHRKQAERRTRRFGVQRRKADEMGKR